MQGDRPNTPVDVDYDMFSRENMAPIPAQQHSVRAILCFYCLSTLLFAGRGACGQLASVIAAAHDAAARNAAPNATV